MYIPGQDPKHRYACLTLYRRLLLLARKVPIKTKPHEARGNGNWIEYEIHKAFARNRRFTSARLVTAAFRNGYKGLAMLKEATDASSARFAEVQAFVNARDLRSNFLCGLPLPTFKKQVKTQRPSRAILKRVPGPPPLPASAEGLDPEAAAKLLNREVPNLGYHYERGKPIVPTEKLKGKRRVPKLTLANFYAPFLRIKKPQPPVLSHVLRQRSDKIFQSLEEAELLESETLVAAKLEDEWDAMVGDGPPPHSQQATSWTEHDPTTGEAYRVESFVSGVKGVIKFHYDRATRLRGDFVLRAQALAKIMQEEQDLANKEAALSKTMKKEAAVRRMQPQEKPDDFTLEFSKVV